MMTRTKATMTTTTTTTTTKKKKNTKTRNRRLSENPTRTNRRHDLPRLQNPLRSPAWFRRAATLAGAKTAFGRAWKKKTPGCLDDDGGQFSGILGKSKPRRLGPSCLEAFKLPKD